MADQLSDGELRELFGIGQADGLAGTGQVVELAAVDGLADVLLRYLVD